VSDTVWVILFWFERNRQRNYGSVLRSRPLRYSAVSSFWATVSLLSLPLDGTPGDAACMSLSLKLQFSSLTFCSCRSSSWCSSA